MKRFIVICSVTFALLPLRGTAQQGTPARETAPLRLVQEIPLPNTEGRMDHFSVDLKRKRVIVSALGNNTVEVVDVFAGKRIHRIEGLDEPQGVAYIPELDKLVVANAGNGKVNIYDGTKFNLITSIDFKDDADNVRYDAAAKKVYVGYGDGAIGVIDVTNNQRLNGDYKLDEHPESFQLETKGSRIFVNVAAKRYIAVIDRNTGSISKWPLEGQAANFPMALDEANRRLFTGTRKPSRLVVFDTNSGKMVASYPCAGDMDDLYYDAGLKRVYIPGGEGYISVFQQNDPDHYEAIGKIPSSIGARTAYFYVQRDRLYLAVPSHANQPAELFVFETQE